MAVYRQPPTCPFCNRVIARAVYVKNPTIIGDNFLRWEYHTHNCNEKRRVINNINNQPIKNTTEKLKDDEIIIKQLKKALFECKLQTSQLFILSDLNTIPLTEYLKSL